MKNIGYSENPEYFKQLISKINMEVDFPAYLVQNGYQLVQKSAGSMEFKNDVDRIVLNISRSPMTYFNRNDSSDKGLFFKFIRKEHSNFYRTIKAGLEVISKITRPLGTESIVLNKKPKRNKSIEENYNIVPLRYTEYLSKYRHLSNSTLNDSLFKGRIFNAYHIRDNGGKIGNVAFPKYDVEGHIKNYILYNKPYRDKKDNSYKKFRMVLNKKDGFLFYSNPDMKMTDKIVFAESGIDLLSYHELHGSPGNFYISFGGNVYTEKLDQFVQLTTRFTSNDKIEFVSAMDNDRAGHEFDIKIFTALINHWNTDIYVESVIKKDNISLKIHYTKDHRNVIGLDRTHIDNQLKMNFGQSVQVFDIVHTLAFSDKLVLEFSLKELTITFDINNRGNGLKILLGEISSLYLPFKTNIHKSRGKDWNEDLKSYKKGKHVKSGQIIRSTLQIGDKIELRTPKGPEGSKNQGIILELRKNGVLCDFGLKHHYAIPFSAIRFHYQKMGATEIGQGFDKTKKHDNTTSIHH